MFDTDEEDSYESLTTEEGQEGYYKYTYESPELVPEYYSSEESIKSVEKIHPAWKKIPRQPADFEETKSAVSSCKDSDYREWLDNYYRDLCRKESKKKFPEKQVDTSDLVSEKPQEIITSPFQPVEKGLWIPSTKYWGPNDVRRHWPLQKTREEVLYLPTVHPFLNLSSRYSRFHAQLNSAAGVPEHNYKNIVCSTLRNILVGMTVNKPQVRKIMIPDNLFNLKWFDSVTKRSVMRTLCKYFRSQSIIEKVYLENMDLDRINGIILLCALSRNGGYTLKELHMWKMFAKGQCPLLLNELKKGEKFVKVPKVMKYFSKIHYFQILNKFSSLTHLSVNYAYLANKNGEALLSLKCIRTQSLIELRLLCLREERPLLTNPGYGVGGWKISDGIWRRMTEWCPNFRVKFVFLDMPQYENVILFLSKSIPVSYVYISSGIDLDFEVPWELDSTLLELKNWYASTLETLCLHLWHHRDLLDIVIRKKILEELPNLITFEFIGVLENVETLEEFCSKLSRGTYKVKTLLFWVEDQYTNKKQLSSTRERVTEIRTKYMRRFQTINIDADINTFALCWLSSSVVINILRKMEGKHLIVSVSSMPPYLSYTMEDDTVVLQGSFGQLWTTMEERLGFSSQYMIESYNTGVLNFRSRRRDVLLRPSVISSDDFDKFDFTSPIASTWYELYLKDSDEINSSNSYVRNWSISIWFLTGFMILLFTALLYFMLHLSSKYLMRNIYIVPPQDPIFCLIQYFSFEENKFNLPKDWRKMKTEYFKMKIRNERSLGNCFLAAISVFCSQGVYLQSTVTSVRLLMLSFLFFGMIMYNSYSALLVSQLTLGERFLPFDTLEEIPTKGQDYSLCVRPESYPYLYFTVNSTRQEIQKKWKGIVNKKPCLDSGFVSLEEMCRPYVAFLETPAVMRESILRNVDCKLTNLRGRYFHVVLSIMIIKGFEEKAKKELNKEILRYREVGILNYLREKWIRENELTTETGNQRMEVTFEHIQGVLLVYFFCIGFSCSVFLTEYITYLTYKKRFRLRLDVTPK